jgi:isopentenyl-diphosphate delta-isomerase
VRHIDVAGAGGTSWSGVELMRRGEEQIDPFWDWGIPTADAVIAARPLCERAGATLIASGGLGGGHDIAVAIALGAQMTGSARILLRALVEEGQEALAEMLGRWGRTLRGMMFLSGSRTVDDLRNARLLHRRADA